MCKLRPIAAVLILVCCGCGAEDVSTDTGPGTDPAAIQAWLVGDGFAEWDAESDVFATSDFGAARSYFNADLARSKQAGQRAHPVGSTAVREFYAADGQTLRGYAYLTRVTDEAGASAWFFFETYDLSPDGSPQVAAAGAANCAGCHQAAPDFVQTPWPLR